MDAARFSRWARCLVLAAAANVVAESSASALGISFDQSVRSTVAGSSVDFSGVIQNDTVYQLLTPTDLFLNFSSYDPTILSPADLLPLSSASLPPGSTSAAFALVGVDVAPMAAPGLYEIQVSIQDIFGGDDADSSGVYTLFISVVPEPATGLLMLLGLAGVSGALRHRGISRGSINSSGVQP